MSLFGKVSETVLGKAKSFPWSSVGSGLLNAAGMAAPAVGAFLSYKQQMNMIKNQQDFQERMRDTAHQAEVKDLIASDLNPVLSATGGNGAAVPAGSTGTQTDFSSAFDKGIGRHFAAQMQKAQLHSMQLQNNVASQQFRKGVMETNLLKKQVDNFEKELNARIKLMSDQGTAAIASGNASSSQASLNQLMAIGKQVDNYYSNLRKQYGDNHKLVRDFGLFLEQSGLGSLFGGLGAGIGAGIGNRIGGGRK